MKVSRDFFKKIAGKIKKITEKIIRAGEKFYTPGCLRMLIPEGTVYYEIVLEKGSILENRYGSPDIKNVEREFELVLFFEFLHGKKLTDERLRIGKKYQFNTHGGMWISNWREITE